MNSSYLRRVQEIGLLISLVAATVSARAEDSSTFIDVQAELTKRLALKPPVAKRGYITRSREECRPSRTAPCSLLPPKVMRVPAMNNPNDATPMCTVPECGTVREQVAITIMEPLRATGFEIVRVKSFAPDETRFRGFPQEVFYLGMSKTNCTSNKSPMLRTMKDSVTVTSSMTIRQGISNTRSLKIDVDYKPKVGWGGGFGATVSTTVSLDKSESTGETRTSDVTLTVNETASAMHRTSKYQYSYKRSAEVPFSGEVVVDAPLDANLDGKTLASQVLSETERTIAVSGVLSFTGWTVSEDYLFEDKLTEEQCKLIRAQLGLEPTEVYTDTLQALGSGRNDAVPLPQDALKSFRQLPTDRERSKKLKGLLKTFRGGTPGNTCSLAPCERPENGLREVCEYDDDGFCTVCGLEEDPICDPPPPPNEKKKP